MACAFKQISVSLYQQGEVQNLPHLTYFGKEKTLQNRLLLIQLHVYDVLERHCLRLERCREMYVCGRVWREQAHRSLVDEWNGWCWEPALKSGAFLCITGNGFWRLGRHPLSSAVHPLLCDGVSLAALLTDSFPRQICSSVFLPHSLVSCSVSWVYQLRINLQIQVVSPPLGMCPQGYQTDLKVMLRRMKEKN